MDTTDKARAWDAIAEKNAEIARLRSALDRIQAVLTPHDDADHIETVGRAREIALATLNNQ